MIILIFQFNNVNGKVFPRMIVLTKQSEGILNRRSSSLTSVLLSAVATPYDSLRLSIRNDVLVSIAQ